uniref:SWIM-type domain-containing protein n=1 Tax=Brassica oleracea TaxID=3712 RepID=A0A3P6C5Y7_BRAOL|nr:unnamed protein product [Brassica oleracea]
MMMMLLLTLLFPSRPHFRLGLPCRHAIAAASCRNMQYTMFVCKHHLKETWAETVRGIILPVPDPKDVEVPAKILTVDLYPPTTKRTKERTRNQT